MNATAPRHALEVTCHSCWRTFTGARGLTDPGKPPAAGDFIICRCGAMHVLDTDLAPRQPTEAEVESYTARLVR